ncbi:hypothetical protein [Nocardia aurea]|uniref:Uncharacterized protein n=1 Tax=Nocardia aurea TaxID=2144174 RepID=A0ABV3FLQ4_9NOCA
MLELKTRLSGHSTASNSLRRLIEPIHFIDMSQKLNETLSNEGTRDRARADRSGWSKVMCASRGDEVSAPSSGPGAEQKV